MWISMKLGDASEYFFRLQCWNMHNDLADKHAKDVNGLDDLSKREKSKEDKREIRDGEY